MLHKIIKVFEYLLLSFLFLECEDSTFPKEDTNGYRPVYSANESITFESNEPIQNPDKVLRFKNYLLIHDSKKGIHIIDNADPKIPLPVGFIRIPDNNDMVIKDSILVVDHRNYLVSLNLTTITKVNEVSRLKVWKITAPPYHSKYFECVDTTKEVVGWVEARLPNSTCYRQ
jgi:hypothetical protein